MDGSLTGYDVGGNSVGGVRTSADNGNTATTNNNTHNTCGQSSLLAAANFINPSINGSNILSTINNHNNLNHQNAINANHHIQQMGSLQLSPNPHKNMSMLDPGERTGGGGAGNDPPGIIEYKVANTMPSFVNRGWRLWKVWYILLLIGLQSFLMHRAIVRYLSFKRYSMDRVYGSLELRPLTFYLAMLLVSMTLFLVSIWATIQRLENLANDSKVLSKNVDNLQLLLQNSEIRKCFMGQLEAKSISTTIWQRVNQNFLPLSNLLHVLSIYALLLPIPLLNAQRIHKMSLTPYFLTHSNFDKIFYLGDGSKSTAGTAGGGTSAGAASQYYSEDQVYGGGASSLSAGGGGAALIESDVEMWMLLFAMAVLCLRYPMVFWHTKRSFSLFFSFITFVLAFHIILDFSATAILFKIAWNPNFVNRPVRLPFAPVTILCLHVVGTLLFPFLLYAVFEFGYNQYMRNLLQHRKYLFRNHSYHSATGSQSAAKSPTPFDASATVNNVNNTNHIGNNNNNNASNNLNMGTMTSGGGLGNFYPNSDNGVNSMSGIGINVGASLGAAATTNTTTTTAPAVSGANGGGTTLDICSTVSGNGSKHKFFCINGYLPHVMGIGLGLVLCAFRLPTYYISFYYIYPAWKSRLLLASLFVGVAFIVIWLYAWFAFSLKSFWKFHINLAQRHEPVDPMITNETFIHRTLDTLNSPAATWNRQFSSNNQLQSQRQMTGSAALLGSTNSASVYACFNESMPIGGGAVNAVAVSNSMANGSDSMQHLLFNSNGMHPAVASSSSSGAAQKLIGHSSGGAGTGYLQFTNAQMGSSYPPPPQNPAANAQHAISDLESYHSDVSSDINHARLIRSGSPRGIVQMTKPVKSSPNGGILSSTQKPLISPAGYDTKNKIDLRQALTDMNTSQQSSSSPLKNLNSPDVTNHISNYHALNNPTSMNSTNKNALFIGSHMSQYLGTLDNSSMQHLENLAESETHQFNMQRAVTFKNDGNFAHNQQQPAHPISQSHNQHLANYHQAVPPLAMPSSSHQQQQHHQQQQLEMNLIRAASNYENKVATSGLSFIPSQSNNNTPSDHRSGNVNEDFSLSESLVIAPASNFYDDPVAAGNPVILDSLPPVGSPSAATTADTSGGHVMKLNGDHSDSANQSGMCSQV